MRRLSTYAARAAAGLLLATLALSPSAATDQGPLQALYSQPWYYTEVVIFTRPAALDHLTEEALAQPAGRLQRDMRTLRSPDTPAPADYDLYPLTRAYLTFPYLDQQRLPDFSADGPELEADDRVEQRPRGVAPPAIHPRLADNPLLDFLDVLAEFEAGLEQDSYRWLPAERFTLRPQAQQLSRRGGFQVLLHGRWLQPIPERDAPQPVLIRAGSRQGASYTLEGILSVTRGRYLHFAADLYYQEPLLGRAPLTFAKAPQPMPAAGSPLTADALTPAGVMQLRESRRVRSEELHYLDHPKLGVLVRIEPVEPPAHLQRAFETLRDSRKERPQ